MLPVLALTTDQLLKVAAGLLIADLVIGVVLAIIIKSVVGKLIVVGLMVVSGIALWSQRSNLKDCIDKVQGQAKTGQVLAASRPTCTFFGRDVELPLDSLTG